MSQDGKIALVTGAGSGIGRGCALALLAAGWHGQDALNSANVLFMTVMATQMPFVGRG